MNKSGKNIFSILFDRFYIAFGKKVYFIKGLNLPIQVFKEDCESLISNRKSSLSQSEKFYDTVSYLAPLNSFRKNII